MSIAPPVRVLPMGCVPSREDALDPGARSASLLDCKAVCGNGRDSETMNSNVLKTYANSALAYAVFAMAGGVFFREFTKLNAFEGVTTLAFVHTHYFALGMMGFLLMLLLEKSLSFTDQGVRKAVVAYHVGLNVTALMLMVRGVVQVLSSELSHGANAAISGIAGLGHIVLGVSIVLILLGVKRAVANAAQDVAR